MRKFITIKTTFPAIHSWTGCPLQEVFYLREPHRHIFYVTMRFEVTHNDRDIEFISQKNIIEDLIINVYRNHDLGDKSCEDIAEELGNKFGASYVSVFEDNENGAEIFF